jgi:hypothetical protein
MLNISPACSSNCHHLGISMSGNPEISMCFPVRMASHSTAYKCYLLLFPVMSADSL